MQTSLIDTFEESLSNHIPQLNGSTRFNLVCFTPNTYDRTTEGSFCFLYQVFLDTKDLAHNQACGDTSNFRSIQRCRSKRVIGRYPLKFWIEEGLVNRCSRTRIPRLGGCCVEAAPLQSKEAQEPGQEFEEEKQGIHRCVSQQTLLATPHSSADGYILL